MFDVVNQNLFEFLLQHHLISLRPALMERMDVELRDIINGHGGHGLSVRVGRSFPTFMIVLFDDSMTEWQLVNTQPHQLLHW